MSLSSQRWLPVLGICLVAVSLASGHVFARFAFANGVDVLTGSAMRTLSASLLLSMLLAMRRIAVVPLPRAFRPTLWLGLLIAIQTALVQLAVALLPVTLAVLAFYTFPVFTGAASALLGYERASPRLALTLIAAFAGLALVLGVGGSDVDPLGVAAGIGAAMTFTAVLVLTPRLAPDLGAPLRTFYTLATAALIFLVALGATGGPNLPANASGWMGLAGLGLCYGAGITGLFLLLPRLGPAQTAILLNLEPVAVAVIAWLALGERLTLWQMAGGALVIVAVALYQAGAGRR